MIRLHRRTWTTRLALWAAVCALLLKSAVPMLASASAELQGKTLVEVCTVYGVTTMAIDADGHAVPVPEGHGTGDAAQHCVLAGLLAWASPVAPDIAWPGDAPALRAPPAGTSADHLPPDAVARWAALRKHGPPRLS